MIITVPIWCPLNWHQQPVAPSGQEERGDSWTVKREAQRGSGEKMEERTGRKWDYFRWCMFSCVCASWRLDNDHMFRDTGKNGMCRNIFHNSTS